MKNNYTKIRMIATIGLIGLVAAGIGNACSGGFNTGSLLSSSTHMQDGGGYNNQPPRDGEVGCNSQADFITVEGTKTSSIKNADNVLNNMIVYGSLSMPEAEGVDETQNISRSTRSVYTERKSSFSKEGYVGDVTSALMMGTAAVAIEYCNDLITYEARKPAAERPYLETVDINATSMNTVEARNLFKRFAIIVWKRPATDSEVNIVTEELDNMGTVNNKTRAIALCTAVMASLNGIRKN
jgi:hypothetical protein